MRSSAKRSRGWPPRPKAASATSSKPRPTPSSRWIARAASCWLNAVSEKMFGYKRDELLGQPMEILVPDRFRGTHHQHRNYYWQHPADAAHGLGPGTAGPAQGRRRAFRSRSASARSSSAEGMRVTAIIRDVTERKTRRRTDPRHARPLHCRADGHEPAARNPQPRSRARQPARRAISSPA